MPKQQTAELKSFFHNKTVLVTGGMGSIGSQIIKRLLQLTPKQVPTCEDHPFEAIQSNLIGGQNVVEAALSHQVQHVFNISTDKALSPVNTMGASKLLSEQLFHQANRHVQNRGTVFCSVRFGNVLGSRGSVISILFEQMMKGEPLTITDKNMTRFFMSIDDAAALTLQSAAIT